MCWLNVMTFRRNVLPPSWAWLHRLVGFWSDYVGWFLVIWQITATGGMGRGHRIFLFLWEWSNLCIHPEDGGSTLLWEVIKFNHYTLQKPIIRLPSYQQPLRKPEDLRSFICPSCCYIALLRRSEHVHKSGVFSKNLKFIQWQKLLHIKTLSLNQGSVYPCRYAG
jgi:hypothetical protein